eukprot:snap_masked-scaffold_6-processed-gene-15.31-mRNA-1 protein AED:1.00 eAED:1.00 QI:0/-1/0/0/-1/1/1/0/118
MRTYKHLSRVRVTTSKQRRIKQLSKIVDEQKAQEIKYLEVKLADNVSFNLNILEENAVKIIFSKVIEIFELLPQEAAKSKKKNCPAISRPLPGCFWIRDDMRAIQSSLCYLKLEKLEQ